ncbi:uncharacterized protein LOC131087583 [Melospiza georgiana]|uniref:uncharacterized protein LOC131087583 n=1 Tax=Melospiza georgiana TaxID=44398 RepID=UPI0025AB78A1|nr:uncharacterized protein LOC131087583 [Melospiza georgiana]
MPRERLTARAVRPAPHRRRPSSTRRLLTTTGTSSRDCLRVLPQHAQSRTPLKCRNRSRPKRPFSPRSHKDPVSQTPFLPPQPQGSRLPNALSPPAATRIPSPKRPFSPRSHKDPVSQTPFLPPQPQGSRLPPWCLVKVTNSDCATIRPPPRPTSTNCQPLTASNPSPQVLAPHWPLPARTQLEGRPLIGRGCSSPGEGEDCHEAGPYPGAGLERPGAGRARPVLCGRETAAAGRGSLPRPAGSVQRCRVLCCLRVSAWSVLLW